MSLKLEKLVVDFCKIFFIVIELGGFLLNICDKQCCLGFGGDFVGSGMRFYLFFLKGFVWIQ